MPSLTRSTRASPSPRAATSAATSALAPASLAALSFNPQHLPLFDPTQAWLAWQSLAWQNLLQTQQLQMEGVAAWQRCAATLTRDWQDRWIARVGGVPLDA